jgi:dTDP-4-amino-4,6-dideoxygalactose transaminase
MSKINLTEMYMDDAIKKAAVDVLESGRFIKGPRVQKFEEKFAQFTGAQYGIATSSGTTALLTTYMALDLKRNDEVIVPSHTFIATATPFLFLRAKPIFVDIDPKTYTLDIEQVKANINPHTKAIVPVHIYGHPADLQPILEIAGESRVRVIEDSCQAHGATYQNQKVGDIGDAAVFSYFPSKNMTVAGDGGMVVTNNKELADKMRILRNHGRINPATSELLGLNFRMSELHAAIGLVELKYLPKWIKGRRAAAKNYNKAFSKTDLVDEQIVLPIERDWATHVYHLYVIRVKKNKRDKLKEYLNNNGIASGIHYPKPLHEQPAIIDFMKTNYREIIRSRLYPETNKAVKEILSLPMYPSITKKQVDKVVNTISAFYREGA